MWTILLHLLIGTAIAQSNLNIVPNYECQLILVVDDLAEQIHEKFLSDYSSGMHGGMERVFKNGSQTVMVQASNSWLAVQWSKNEEIIAIGHFVISRPSDFDRVILMINPKNPNEQVSLDCHPESAI